MYVHVSREMQATGGLSNLLKALMAAFHVYENHGKWKIFTYHKQQIPRISAQTLWNFKT